MKCPGSPTASMTARAPARAVTTPSPRRAPRSGGSDNARDAHARVERGVRILEHWLHELRAREPAVGADRPAGERTVPAVGASMPRISRASVLLPQPDSPTRPSVSPLRTTRSMPRSAWSVPPAPSSRPADGVGLGGAPDRENVGGHHTPSARRVQAPASRPLPSSGSTQRTRRPSGAGLSGTAPAALRALA